VADLSPDCACISQASDLPLVRMDNPIRIKMEEDDGYAGAANMFGVHTVSVSSHFKEFGEERAV